MSLIQTVILGAIAGFTIYLGLPICRVKGLSDKFRSFLSMLSTGILFFLFLDIFGNIAEPIETSLHQKSLGEFFAFFAIFVGGVIFCLLVLISFLKRLFLFCV